MLLLEKTHDHKLDAEYHYAGSNILISFRNFKLTGILLSEG